MARRTFSIGGVHPADSKISRDCRIEALPLPPTVYISVAQHIGAPATAVVKVGDEVERGQMIAEPSKGLSVAIHASISGTVTEVHDKYVVIEK